MVSANRKALEQFANRSYSYNCHAGIGKRPPENGFLLFDLKADAGINFIIGQLSLSSSALAMT